MKSLFYIKTFLKQENRSSIIKNTSNKTQILSNHSMCLTRYSKNASEFHDVIVEDFQFGE